MRIHDSIINGMLNLINGRDILLFVIFQDFFRTFHNLLERYRILKIKQNDIDNIIIKSVEVIG